jgi:GNAT superfamily N-acetyltransferase
MPDASFEFTIRPATTADAAHLTAHRMELVANRDAVVPDAAAFETMSARAVTDLLNARRAGAWLAIARTGEVIGSAFLLYVDRLPSLQNRSPVEGYLAQLHVVEGWRWHGVGMALMRAVTAEARRRALGRVRLHSTNEALGFYERCGFTARSNDLELHL